MLYTVRGDVAELLQSSALSVWFQLIYSRTFYYFKPRKDFFHSKEQENYDQFILLREIITSQKHNYYAFRKYDERSFY